MVYEFIGGPRDGETIESTDELDIWYVPIAFRQDFTCHQEFDPVDSLSGDKHVYQAGYLRRGTTFYRVLTWEGIR